MCSCSEGVFIVSTFQSSRPQLCSSSPNSSVDFFFLKLCSNRRLCYMKMSAICAARGYFKPVFFFFFFIFFVFFRSGNWTVGISAQTHSQTQTTAEVFTSTYQRRQWSLATVRPVKCVKCHQAMAHAAHPDIWVTTRCSISPGQRHAAYFAYFCLSSVWFYFCVFLERRFEVLLKCFHPPLLIRGLL